MAQTRRATLLNGQLRCGPGHVERPNIPIEEKINDMPKSLFFFLREIAKRQGEPGLVFMMFLVAGSKLSKVPQIN